MAKPTENKTAPAPMNEATKPAGKGVLFDPTQYDWGPNVRFVRVPGAHPDIASADVLGKLGIAPRGVEDRFIALDTTPTDRPADDAEPKDKP